MQTPVRNVMENTCKIFSTMKYEFDFVSLTFSPIFEGRRLSICTLPYYKIAIRLLEYFAKVISLLPPIEIKEKNILTFFPRKTDWKFKNTKIENSLNNDHEFIYSRIFIKFSLRKIYSFDYCSEIFASNKVLIFQICKKRYNVGYFLTFTTFIFRSDEQDENDETITKRWKSFHELIHLQRELTLKFIYKLAEICIRTIALSRNFRLIPGVCAFYGFLKEPSRSGEREMRRPWNYLQHIRIREMPRSTWQTNKNLTSKINT